MATKTPSRQEPPPTTTITVTDLREELRKYIELAHYKGQHFVVERNREEFVVILSVEDYRRLVAVAESKV
jgi:prevent-host-death family protein